MSNFLTSHRKASNSLKSQAYGILCKVQASNEGVVSRLGMYVLQKCFTFGGRF